MKKLLIIVSLLFTLIVAGVLYGEHVPHEVVGTVAGSQALMNQFPDTVPDISYVNPATVFCLLR